jgi:hypothetical protein
MGAAAARFCRLTLRLADRLANDNRVRWLDAWQEGVNASTTRSRFASKGQRAFLHANILVLKPNRSLREKGVVLIKYTELANAIPLLFDLERIQERYHVVIEPSFSGHMQPFVRLFDHSEAIVVVQTALPKDAAGFCGQGFTSVDLCNGDWVDEAAIYPLPNATVKYDVAFIGNAIPFKRHAFLLQALRRHWQGPVRIALLTSRWVGGGERGLRNMLERFDLSSSTDIFVDLERRQSNEVLNSSACHVRCSLGGGADKASFEALFAGVPAVVPRDPDGFPARRFPSELVRTYTTARELVACIASCRSNQDRERIGATVRQLSGSLVATNRLTDAIRRAAFARGEEWTVDLLPKANRVHACYRTPDSFEVCVRDYAFLAGCARSGFSFDPELARSLVTRVA